VAGRVSLALVIHNHQPVGNFGWVIEDVYEHAYRPMLEALERHPSIHLGLHYSGPLLQWLTANRPEAIELIRALAARGQVEIVGGGYYEPILVTLPDRDRQGQLVRMRDELAAVFGRQPRGAWLAERVWEPSLPYDLAAAGYEWTYVDDSHLRAASIPEDEMWSPIITDDRGLRLTVFGTEQGLRYLIPFKPVEDLVAYLRQRVTEDGRFVGMMGDDGEKFGSWPGTYEYCWSRERWVERMFEAIEAADWLAAVTPSEWLAANPPTRRAYFPTASYLEMTEWALPPDETPVFVSLIEEARERGDPAARFLRGGFWRNFAARYREINELHKQMLRVSDKVAAMAEGPAPEPDKVAASDHLYQGQSNDCYWHGLFGGIYIPHMRMATLSHLIAAEDLADRALAAAGGEPYGIRLVDTDLDATDEILVAAPGQTIVVDAAEGAGISSWDLRACRLALASVMRRRPEAYHARLREAYQAAGAGTADAREAASGGPKTIHEIVRVKEPGLTSLLHYDRHERRSGLVHLLPADGSTALEQLITQTYDELGDFVDAPFGIISLGDDRGVFRRLGSVRVAGGTRALSVKKSLRFGGDRPTPALELAITVENLGDSPLAFELAVEWNVDLLGGGHNPAAWYETADGVRSPHDTSGEAASAAGIAFGNDYEGIRVEAAIDPPARLTWYPVETVSNSEAGFERVYQGSCLLFRWPITLAPGERAVRPIALSAAQSIDRSAREAARG
jgi:hypothetical protein